MEDLNYYKSLLNESPRRIVGLGLTAFSRITPALVTDNFEVVCYKWGSDLSSLERLCPIRAIQRDFEPNEITKLNTQSILRHPGVLAYLRSLGEIAVFQYKTTEWVENFCRREGWLLLTNPRRLRDQFEDKDSFFKLVRRLKLPKIPGEQWEFEDLDEDSFREIAKRLGKRVVMQLTSFSEGGGKGTYFVGNMSEFRAFKEKAEQRLDLEKSQIVNVVKFIAGISASIAGCVTGHGVLTGIVQTQILDVPELVWTESRRGIWRGHDWSFRKYSQDIQRQADRIARRIGEEMQRAGYKGIFGVDLMIDQGSGEVYPNEINPRYTGAFPVYAFLQFQGGEIPFDIFHILEFLDVSYKLDFDEVNTSWKQAKQGAFVNLHNQDPERWAQAAGKLPAGIYRLKRSASSVQRLGYELEWVREGATPLDLQRPDEFVVTDGIPKFGDLVKPHLRCGKIIFGNSILEGRHNRLNEWARTIIAAVYGELGLQPVSFDTEEGGDTE